MFKTMIKTASLSLAVLLAASNAPALDSAKSAPRARSSHEIDQGWAVQIQRFEERLAARGLSEADIPGAIISAPLPGFEAPAESRAARQAEAAAPSQTAERPHRTGTKFQD